MYIYIYHTYTYVLTKYEYSTEDVLAHSVITFSLRGRSLYCERETNHVFNMCNKQQNIHHKTVQYAYPNNKYKYMVYILKYATVIIHWYKYIIEV